MPRENKSFYKSVDVNIKRAKNTHSTDYAGGQEGKKTKGHAVTPK
jgi:hypothetical protein